MHYETYRYLWPPRPERVIAPPALEQIERMGYWAQAKMNGTNCTLYVPPNGLGGSFAMGRHGPDNTLQWQPGGSWEAFTNSLDQSWYVFQGELLHSKVKGGPRDTIVLFDVLVAGGEYLLGKTYAQRYHLLEGLLEFYGGELRHEDTHRRVNAGLWLIDNRTQGFRAWFDKPGKAAYIEGVVCKKPDAGLQLCARQSSNAAWQVKCRYPKANLSF